MTDVFKDTTTYSLFFELVDSTTGLPKTGIVYTDVTGSYVRTRSVRVAISMATLTGPADGFSAGGFILIDDTNQPGIYRLDVPAGAFATGAFEVVISVKATGCRTVSRQINLVNTNNQVAAADDAILTVLGTPAGVSVSADIAAVKSDTGTLVSRVTTTVVTLWANLTAMITGSGASAKYTTGALSNAPSGGGGSGSESDLMVSTTIATVTSQTVLVLTDGSADNDAYNDQLVVITDTVTSTQKARCLVLDYVGSTKTLTLVSAPVFTVAAGDAISILAIGSKVTSAEVAGSGSPAVTLTLGATIPLALGEVTGFDESLVIGDDYTVDVGRRIPVTLTDINGDAIAVTYGSYSLATDCDIKILFHPEGRNTVVSAITGSCTFVAAVGATPAYLWVTLPRAETAKAVPGKYQMQIEARWTDGFNVTLAHTGIATFARDLKRS